MSSTSDAAQQAVQLLVAGQYYEALRSLNSLTTHRFTAVYRREATRAWNVVLFDRADPHAPQFPDVSAGDTYCSLAMQERQPVVVLDSLADPRLVAHGAREVVRSYCGAPLLGEDGEPFGTLCHFDYDPVQPPAETADLLGRIALLLDLSRVLESLERDVCRRLDNLASTLPLLAASLAPDECRRSAFEEMAGPVRALLHRLHGAVHDGAEQRLDALWRAFDEACDAPT